MKAQQFIYKSSDIAELDARNDKAQQAQRLTVEWRWSRGPNRQRVDDGGLGIGGELPALYHVLSPYVPRYEPNISIY